MAVAELSEINRSIKVALGESAGNFRKASNDNNAVMGRMFKDLSRYFASQRAQISELVETNNMIEQNTAKMVSKFDRLASVLTDSINIQTQLYNEMRTVSDNIRSLHGTMNTMNNNISSSSVGGGVLGTLAEILTKASLIGQGISFLGTVVSGLVTAGGAASLISQELGGGGGATGATGTGEAGKPGAGGGFSEAIPSAGQNKAILETIRTRESGGNYQAQAKTSSASGAYQFIDSTWQTWQKKSGVGTNYAKAKDAPPEIQDKVADAYVSDILKRAGGDVSKVPLEWFTGNLQGKMSAKQQAANPGITAESYQAKWLKDFQKHGGSTSTQQTAQQNVQPQSTPLHLQQPAGEHPGMLSGSSSGGHSGGQHATKTGETTPKGILPAAEQFLGKSESNAQEELQQFIGKNHHQIDIKKTPWCAAFVNGVLGSQGLPGTGSDLAKSFLSYGAPVWDRNMGTDMKNVQPGDIAVFNRGGDKGHVGIVKSVSGDSISIIGGNQSDQNSGGQVSVSTRNINQSGGELLAIRRPGGSGPASAGQVTPKNTPGASAGTPGSPPSGAMGGAGGAGGVGASGTGGLGGGQSPAGQISPAAISALTGGASLEGLQAAATSLAATGMTSGISSLTGGASLADLSGATTNLSQMNTGALLTPSTASDASMVNAPNQSSMNVQQLNEEAVAHQAQNQINSEKASQNSVSKAQEDNNLYNANIREGMPIASDYNRPEDKMLAPEWMHGIEYRGYREFNPLKYG